MTTPTLLKIKSGWLAKGGGWAVEAATKEAAMRAYRAAERRHRQIDARPMPSHVVFEGEREEVEHGK